MIDIREARKEDCREIRKLIQELADFEKMPDGPRISHEDLERDGFETNPPLFKALVAVDNGKIIGQALYFYIYSSWKGKSMFLDDLYVSPEYRKKGVGGRMFDAVAKEAANQNCNRMDFSVLNWNPAQEMYKHKGAEDITKTEAWHIYRLNGEALEKYRTSA